MHLKKRQRLPLLSTDEINVLKKAVEFISKNNNVSTPFDARLTGERAISRRGQGMDLVDIRCYQLGDDVKAIDWHTTARRGRPYIKIFEEEFESETCIFVQQDQNMLFATQGDLKITVAAQCAAILSFNAKKNHSPLAGMCMRQGIDYFEASLSEQALFRWVLHCCLGIEDDMASDQPLAKSLLQLTSFARSQTHIFVICNNLQNLSAEERACFIQLRQHNHVTVIQIIDPIEIKIPSVGAITVNIPGQGSRVLNTDDEDIRHEYLQSQKIGRRETQAFFKRIKVNYLYLFTHKNVLEQLRLIL